MFQFEVSEFKGCRLAEISVSGIALLAGDGGACKSSILQAIGAVTTGETIPVAGVKKSEALCLVRSGAEKGSVTWSGDGFSQSITYPKAEAVLKKGSTPPPAVSVYATGLRNILDQKPKDRAPVLYPLLGADPTIADVAAALREEGLFQPSDSQIDADAARDMGLNPDLADDRGLFLATQKLWNMIQAKGWNTAHAEKVDEGKTDKGSWRQATGGNGNWGASIGETWRPDGWDDDLASASIDDLEGDVSRAKEAEAIAQRAAGASDAIKADLREKCANLPALQAELVKLTREADRAREAWRTFSIKAPPVVPSAPLECPHCKGSVTLRDDLAGKKLEKATAVPQSEIDAAKEARRQYDADRAAQEKATNAALGAASDKEREVMAAQVAKQKLDAMSAVSGGGDIAAAEAALALAVKRRDAFKAYAEATRLHRKLMSNAKLVQLLSEDKGIRAVKLKDALESFNKHTLAKLCGAAGWKPVTINDDFEVEYGGRSFPMLCKSEQHRCRIIMQVAIAHLDGSALVVIDDADTIPVGARPGLLKMIKSLGIHAVIAMMLAKPDMAPDLAKAGFGATYWIEAGEAMPWSEAMKQRAAEKAA